MGFRSLAESTGNTLDYCRDKTRVNVLLPKELFSDLKESAVANNRSLSQEARTMIECALQAQKKMTGR